jgi:hypothetical protein
MTFSVINFLFVCVSIKKFYIIEGKKKGKDKFTTKKRKRQIYNEKKEYKS